MNNEDLTASLIMGGLALGISILALAFSLVGVFK